MSGYSPSLRLVQPVPFDPAVRNLWGALLNTDFALIDTAIVGQLGLNVAGSANVVLTQVDGAADQSRNAHYVMSGVLTGNIIVLWPQFQRIFSVRNNTSGAFTLACGVNNGAGAALGTTVTVPQGNTVTLISDGTNVTSRSAASGANTDITSLTNISLLGTVTLPGTMTMAQNGSAGQVFTLSQNASSALKLLNANAGTAARAYFNVGNGTADTFLFHYGTGWTTTGMNRQDGGQVMSNGAGGLTLATGANQPIYFAVNSIEVGRWTSTGLGIGMTPSNVLDITQSTNGAARISVLNSNAGTGAISALALSNGTSDGLFYQFGASFTTSGVRRQNGMFLSGEGAGGLTLNTGANQPIFFGINGSEVGRWTASGLGIGMTPSTILDITQTQNAASEIKLLNASAGAAARGLLRLSNGASDIVLQQLGTGFTPSGVGRADGTQLVAGGAGGLTLGTGAVQPIYFAVNNTEVAQFNSTALLLAAGIGLTVGTGALSVSGTEVTPPTSSTVGAGNNLVIASSYHRFTGTGTVSGVVGGVDGRRLTIGSTTSPVIISNQNASSTAGNRFDLPGGSDLTLDDDATATFIYNGASSRWNLIAFSG